MCASQVKRAPVGLELGGFVGGLTDLIDKLDEPAEAGAGPREAEPSGQAGGGRGENGFAGREQETRPRPAPTRGAGNGERPRRPSVYGVMEPPVDIFDEPEYVLVVAEMAGVGAEDIEIEMDGDILTITAARGAKRYRTEILLPSTFSGDAIARSCHNGIVEIRLAR